VIVVLDATAVGLLANQKQPPVAIACYRWASRLVNQGVRACLPEVFDYEIRRETIRRGSTRGLVLLDRLALFVEYVPIRTPVMRRAAELWAQARNRGMPTADEASLDVDVILAAQAQLLGEATGDEVVVATDNIRHLAQFVDARRWQEIEP
jgi:predicted nucleic acid-binding protein